MKHSFRGNSRGIEMATAEETTLYHTSRLIGRRIWRVKTFFSFFICWCIRFSFLRILIIVINLENLFVFMWTFIYYCVCVYVCCICLSICFLFLPFFSFLFLFNQQRQHHQHCYRFLQFLIHSPPGNVSEGRERRRLERKNCHEITKAKQVIVVNQ